MAIGTNRRSRESLLLGKPAHVREHRFAAAHPAGPAFERIFDAGISRDPPVAIEEPPDHMPDEIIHFLHRRRYFAAIPETSVSHLIALE